MSDKKPSSPLMGWFEAGLGLVADQFTEVNKQVQQKMEASQKSLDELAARGAKVENEMLKIVNPDQWMEVWRQSPLHHWMPSFTSPRQKRAMQIEALSAKVDLLVEQVALLAAKQAQAKAKEKAEAPAKKAPAKTGTRSTAKPAAKRTTTTRKRAPAKPKSDSAE